ncbi:MAG: AAA family ATPase [Patescibacteria group bacterium]|jgi:chromosome segregation protein
MYLEKLVITGFKSFAKTTEFKFDYPFVAVVGPNGSGKTNVTDALRWVMGEQALKLLRIKQATDVIFAGSEQLSRGGLARVDLYLNNEGKRLKIDYDQVVISRQIARDGETEYLINNNPARLQDILLLLAQANFGQKSYGVIGQGMITDIINANPQDRKQFFDEATGIKEHQMKRDTAIHKLIRTEENLLRVEDLLKEVEPRLRSLTRQVKKLQQRQELEQQLQQTQTQYYGSMLVDLQQKLTKQQQLAQQLQQERTAQEQILTALEAEIDKVNLATSRTVLYQQLQQDQAQVLAKKQTLLKDQAVLQGRLQLEQEQHGEIELIWLERRLNELTQQIQTQHNLREQIIATITHQELQLNSISTAQAQVKQETIQLEQELQAARETLAKVAITVALPEVKQRLTQLFQVQEQFLRSLLNTVSLDQFKTVQQQAQNITKQLAELLDDLHEEDREAIALQQQAITALTQRAKITTELKEKLLQDYAELKAVLQTKRDQLDQVKTSIKQLENEQQGAKNDIANQKKTLEQNQNRSVQLANLQKQSEALVAQLTTVDSELQTKQQALQQFNQTEETKQRDLLDKQTQGRKIQAQLNQIANKQQVVEVQITKLQTHQEDLLAELSREVSAVVQKNIEQYTELRQDQEQLLIEIERLKHQLELIGGIDPEIVQEQISTEERFTFLKQQAKDLRQAIMALEQVIDELDKTIKKQFNQSFKAITKSFNKYFKLLFAGGEAKLDLLIEQPVVEETTTEIVETQPELLGKRKQRQRIVSGIDIIAQPPSKKLSSVQALSGGEKSMTAIALICAIIDANTPPFVVLDEVEAALDEINSEKFSAIIKQLSQKTQFIVISHNQVTMRQADVLYGVTMNKAGVSKILSVQLTAVQ